MNLLFTGCNWGTNPGNEPEDTEKEKKETVSAMGTCSGTKVDDTDFVNMDARQFTRIMGNGINLGNTMEAAYWEGYNCAVTKYETGWGAPVTTEEMFKAFKEAGFDSVRIPVAWTNTIDWRNDDYTINDDFMARIKEIVGYAYKYDMFVMINDHWDNGWWGLFGSDKTTAYKIFDAIWDQVGTAFKDYDYHLIFEAGNEEWGERFNDTVDSVDGTLTVDEQYALITELAQHFVDKIRAQGSYNAKRFLLIPGYNTDFEMTCDSRYAMPEDSANEVNKLIVSVHYYQPPVYSIVSNPANSWGFSNTWGTTSEVSAQNALFLKMKKFHEEGYGVIIGEYGVALEQTAGTDTANDKSDDTFIRKSNDTEWMTNILDNCDKYNYCPFLWDIGKNYFNREGTEFGFIGDYEDVGDVFSNRNYAAEKAESYVSGSECDTSDDSGTTGSTNKNVASSFVLAVNGTSVEANYTLTEALSVTTGKTIVLTYTRPAIAHDYANHYMQSYNGSGAALVPWTGSNPSKNAGTVTIKYTAESDFTLTYLTIGIYDPEDTDTTQTASVTITDLSVTLE